MPEEEFAYFRFTGERFKNREEGMPLEALAELVTYRDLVSEIARALWKRSHPERVRAPRNWAGLLDLRLTEIGDGSVRPIVKRRNDQTLPVGDTFDDARDYLSQTVSDVARGNGLRSDFPPACVPRLSRLGQALKPGDRVFFGHPTQADRRAELNDSIARTLSEIAEQLTDERPDTTLQGHIVEMDTDAATFQLRTSDDRRVGGRYAAADAEAVHQWLDVDGGGGETVEVTGIALVNTDGAVLRFSPDEPVAIRQVPVEGMLAVFRALADVPESAPVESLKILNRRSRLIGNHYPKFGIAEHSEGILRVEWSDNARECSAEIEPDGSLYLHAYDRDTEQDEEYEGMTDQPGLEALDRFLEGGSL
ncbi:hypothetical protein [Pimelobacter simplex]|uniref:hypothetical protein n=1 Tax=Nocardioides simplex TaxID=2045 RepID=UPI00214FFA8B|nr:hypothetical protein [Pimelobacter simplex]UUW87384.1 hypothetical protein M0M43_16715 [Pimelobacter simplex]UUW96889.1 hypothetical protein M0M48_05360 [Pimelobacter simplex]